MKPNHRKRKRAEGRDNVDRTRCDTRLERIGTSVGRGGRGHTAANQVARTAAIIEMGGTYAATFRIKSNNGCQRCKL